METIDRRLEEVLCPSIEQSGIENYVRLLANSESGEIPPAEKIYDGRHSIASTGRQFIVNGSGAVHEKKKNIMAGRKSNQLRSGDDIDTKPKGKNKKKPTGALDALAIAEEQVSTKPGLRAHRFGDLEDVSKRKRDDLDGPDSKRRRTEGILDEDGGSDSEGNEWTVGQIDSEDDSEIDSDEAFVSSDEERFEGFTFRGGSSNSKKKSEKKTTSKRGRKQLDLSEDWSDEEQSEDDDLEDDLGEDAVDLATAWDMNASSDDETAVKTADSDKKRADEDEFSGFSDSVNDGGSEEEEGDDSEEDEESDDDDDLSLSDSGEEDEAGLSKLQDFVNSIETTSAGKSSAKVNRGQENQAPTEYSLTSNKKLTVADLIPTVTDSRLKSSLKHIDPCVSSTKAKPESTGKLSAPLPKRQQDRIERAAAYEKSKETLNRWVDTVKANREAEHLSFPLPDPHEQNQTTLPTVQPQTNLENAIQSILVESGLAADDKDAEKQIQASEELEARKMSIEEVRARTAELRKRRDLLFREEMRAKRIKKIKSKAYRRVHRRERQKLAELERQAALEAGIDLDEEGKERLDRQRAEARMTSKLKQSKWARSLKETGRAAWDDEARSSLAELARREEELQRRIEGKRPESDNFLGSSSESEDDYDMDDPESEAKKLSRELDRLENADVDESTGPHSKLMSMKFMQKAEAARKQRNEEEIRSLRRQLQGEESESEEEEEGGRRKYGQKQETKKRTAVAERSEFEEPLASDDESRPVPDPDPQESASVAKQSDKKPAKGSSKQPAVPEFPPPAKAAGQDDEAPENPWLSQTTKPNRKRTETAEQAVTIVTNGTLPESSADTKTSKKTAKGSSQPSQHSEPKPSQQHQQSHSTQQTDEPSDSEEEAPPVLLKNQDLVKRAFAGDDVVQEFRKEKQEVIEEEGDKIIDNTLPGWGSWTGEGLSKKQKKQKKRFLTKVEGVQPEKRKDAKLGNVIINEKRVRKVRSVASLLYDFATMTNIVLECQVSGVAAPVPVRDEAAV